MNPQATPLRLKPSSDPSAAVADRLCLTYEQRTRSRLLVRLDSGAEAAVVLPRGTHLRDGDRLQAEDGRVVVVVAARESLLEARIDDATRLARAAYHLGNRHVAVQICDGALRISDDTVLERMLANLDLAPFRIDAPFEPEGGAYGHSHAHTADSARLAPIIHEYRRS